MRANKLNQYHPKNVKAQTSWEPPGGNWIKINVDGFLYDQSYEAACAGMARDSPGSWVFEFGRKLSPCSSLHAEMWAILTVMEVAWERGFRRVIVESDCSEAVELIVKETRERCRKPLFFGLLKMGCQYFLGNKHTRYGSLPKL